MSELRINEIPVPLANYIRLIKHRYHPYYDIVRHVVNDMEKHYKRTEHTSGIVYTINPRVLHEQIEAKVKSEKLTTVNICRSILALIHGSELREEDDFYVTTTSHGRRNYHIKVNDRTLNSMFKLV
ncbi:MAG: hypothetical protein PVH12_04400 [Candidatus Bathyarchaeota archaeon]|jgi:hypothetical protein